MQQLLKKGEIIEACDASIKDRAMGAYWVKMTKKNEILMSHEMHAKDWSFNTPKTADAVILLDLISMLQSRSWNTVIHMDNKDIWRRVNTRSRVANHFNQDLAAEIKAIQIK